MHVWDLSDEEGPGGHLSGGSPLYLVCVRVCVCVCLCVLHGWPSRGDADYQSIKKYTFDVLRISTWKGRGRIVCVEHHTEFHALVTPWRMKWSSKIEMSVILAYLNNFFLGVRSNMGPKEPTKRWIDKGKKEAVEKRGHRTMGKALAIFVWHHFTYPPDHCKCNGWCYACKPSISL